LEKETQANRGDVISKNIQRHLRVEPVKKSAHLLFNLLEFTFFNSSENGSAMPFGNSGLLAFLIVAPYVLFCEVIFFRRKRLFVKLKNHVAGTLVVHEESNALYVKSLAVAPGFRRLGVATFILTYVERSAKIIGKKSIELSVLKSNFPAQRLYRRFGFAQKEEKRRSFVLTKRV